MPGPERTPALEEGGGPPFEFDRPAGDAEQVARQFRDVRQVSDNRDPLDSQFRDRSANRVRIVVARCERFADREL